MNPLLAERKKPTLRVLFLVTPHLDPRDGMLPKELYRRGEEVHRAALTAFSGRDTPNPHPNTFFVPFVPFGTYNTVSERRQLEEDIEVWKRRYKDPEDALNKFVARTVALSHSLGIPRKILDVEPNSWAKHDLINITRAGLDESQYYDLFFGQDRDGLLSKTDADQERRAKAFRIWRRNVGHGAFDPDIPFENTTPFRHALLLDFALHKIDLMKQLATGPWPYEVQPQHPFVKNDKGETEVRVAVSLPDWLESAPASLNSAMNLSGSNWGKIIPHFVFLDLDGNIAADAKTRKLFPNLLPSLKEKAVQGGYPLQVRSNPKSIFSSSVGTSLTAEGLRKLRKQFVYPLSVGFGGNQQYFHDVEKQVRANIARIEEKQGNVSVGKRRLPSLSEHEELRATGNAGSSTPVVEVVEGKKKVVGWKGGFIPGKSISSLLPKPVEPVQQASGSFRPSKELLERLQAQVTADDIKAARDGLRVWASDEDLRRRIAFRRALGLMDGSSDSTSGKPKGLTVGRAKAMSRPELHARTLTDNDAVKAKPGKTLPPVSKPLTKTIAGGQRVGVPGQTVVVKGGKTVGKAGEELEPSKWEKFKFRQRMRFRRARNWLTDLFNFGNKDEKK